MVIIDILLLGFLSEFLLLIFLGILEFLKHLLLLICNLLFQLDNFTIEHFSLLLLAYGLVGIFEALETSELQFL